MKILFTGGGTGGHFYPIVAIVEAIYEIVEEKRLIPPKLILVSDSKFNNELLKKEDIIFKKITSGKIRRYFSLSNLIDIPKTIAAIVKSLIIIYKEMPDVIFGKGAYISFPILLAARIFKIPVMIHESDTVPGIVNRWAGKFAERIAISFPETIKYFPKEKTALTGVPIRKSILGETKEEAKEIFNLEENIPTILVLGGSQGCLKINEIIIDILNELVNFAQIIHQTGKKYKNEICQRASVVLENSLFKNRYHPFEFLDEGLMRNAYSVANLVVSRAGATSIFEIAARGIPSILIPIKNSAQDHQRKNAYAYAKSGGAKVIEEDNLTPHILLSNLKNLLSNRQELDQMKKSAENFAKKDAAKQIAEELINMALKHSE